MARMIELIKKLAVIQAYAPKNDAIDEEKDNFTTSCTALLQAAVVKI